MYVKWKAVNGPTRSASSFKACPEAFYFFNGTSCKGVILFLNNWYLPLFKNNLGSQTAIKDQKSLPQCQCHILEASRYLNNALEFCTKKPLALKLNPFRGTVGRPNSWSSWAHHHSIRSSGMLRVVDSFWEEKLWGFGTKKVTGFLDIDTQCT